MLRPTSVSIVLPLATRWMNFWTEMLLSELVCLGCYPKICLQCLQAHFVTDGFGLQTNRTEDESYGDKLYGLPWLGLDKSYGLHILVLLLNWGCCYHCVATKLVLLLNLCCCSIGASAKLVLLLNWYCCSTNFDANTGVTAKLVLQHWFSSNASLAATQG